MNIPTIEEWHMMQMAKHIVEAAHYGARSLFYVGGRFEHHDQYSAGAMRAERRGNLVGVYTTKAKPEEIVEDMKHELE